MKKGVSFLLVILVFLACVKKPDYPDTPVIVYKQFGIRDGNFGLGQLVFSYTDGNADLGYSVSQRNATNYDIEFKVLNVYPDNTTKTAVDIKRQIKNGDTTFVQDSIFENYLPLVDLNGQSKAIEGEVFYNSAFNPNDSSRVKIVFYIYDRARNKSNIEETPIIQFK